VISPSSNLTFMQRACTLTISYLDSAIGLLTSEEHIQTLFPDTIKSKQA